MKTDKIAKYQVVDDDSVMVLGKFEPAMCAYKAVCCGVRGYHEGNALVLWDEQNRGEMFWLSEDMNYCWMISDKKAGEYVKQIARIGSMFLVEFVKQDKCYYKAFGVQLANSYDSSIALKQIYEAQRQADHQAGQKYESHDIYFWVEEDSGRKTCDEVFCGEKVEAPENVYVFWNGEILAMLGYYFPMYFLVCEECKSFRKEDAGLVLTKKDGREDFFPYCPIELKFEA